MFTNQSTKKAIIEPKLLGNIEFILWVFA